MAMTPSRLVNLSGFRSARYKYQQSQANRANQRTLDEGQRQDDQQRGHADDERAVREDPRGPEALERRRDEIACRTHMISGPRRQTTRNSPISTTKLTQLNSVYATMHSWIQTPMRSPYARMPAPCAHQNQRSPKAQVRAHRFPCRCTPSPSGSNGPE